ncbi:hypothetical protein G9H64_09975 [Aquirufa nivalisilvae]|uniref:hypothetical protein n=1 Tax=Aquirufa nivalisilvae TaxID=2516557 RepID=UPI0022A8F184|nr:hypothetical protein [Aquirufa nivalisilvae]MCZ2479052.1 hypothetical protein [Aquirufa nivalisilvae]MCZ2483283.1 hypothetical protein [Aquirufa nivalisilvae]
MKKHFHFALVLLIFLLISCEKSNEEKAKESIYTFLNENLDDMTTYEPIKFGSLDTVLKVINLEEFDQLNRDNWKDINLEMFHSYRIKEGDRKRIFKRYFKLNRKLEVIALSDYTYLNSPYQNNLMIGIDTAAADTTAY